MTEALEDSGFLDVFDAIPPLLWIQSLGEGINPAHIVRVRPRYVTPPDRPRRKGEPEPGLVLDGWDIWLSVGLPNPIRLTGREGEMLGELLKAKMAGFRLPVSPKAAFRRTVTE